MPEARAGHDAPLMVYTGGVAAEHREPAVKLICLNIEREKHLGRLLPFLRLENPDVACLQEVFLDDLFHLGRELAMHVYFAPMTLYVRGDDVTAEHEPEGVAILSKLPLQDVRRDYYATGGRVAGHVVPFRHEDQETMQRVLLSGLLRSGAAEFRIATTHFTWTPDGHPDYRQRRDIQPLMALLGTFGDIVFCGDFNAPRGEEIFARIAARYVDGVPPAVTTTLDQHLHRVKGLQHVVDTIFTTPAYTTDVEVIDGVSDHCALVGRVCRAQQRSGGRPAPRLLIRQLP